MFLPFILLFVSALFFACDTERLYLRCDLRRWGRFQIVIVFHQPAGVLVLCPPITRGHSGVLTVRSAHGERQAGEFAADEIVELSIPLPDLGAKDAVQFQVKILHDGIERECYPESAPIELAIPNGDAALTQWVV